MSQAIAIEPRPDCLRASRRRQIPNDVFPAGRRDANTLQAVIAGRRHIYAWAGPDSADLRLRPVVGRAAAEVWDYRTANSLPVMLGHADHIGEERI